MANESRLSITIDSRNAEQKAEDLAKALNAMDGAGIRVSATALRAGKSADTAGRSFSTAGSDAKRGAAGVDGLDRSLRKANDSAATAAATIRRTLIGAFAGLSVMNVIDAADDWGQYASRMKMATQSTEEYTHAQDRMLQSANLTFRSIQETRESFIQLSPVLREMGQSLDQSIDTVEAFSSLLVVNGANAERGAAAMQALAKSFQRGRVDAMAWMTIYSTVDTIVDAIAESSGKTAEEIRKMGVEGKITADMMAKALLNVHDKAVKQVEDMPTTVRDAFTQLNNVFGEYVGKTNEANGATQILVNGINALSENFETLANGGLYIAGGLLAVYTGRVTAATTATISATLASANQSRALLAEADMQVKATAATLAATRAGMGLTATTAELTAATTAHTAALARQAAAQAATVTVGSRLLGLFGGPVGLVVSLGLAAAAAYTFGGNSKQASSDVDLLADSVDGLAASLRGLNKAGLQSAAANIQTRIEESARLAVEAQDKLKDLQSQLAQAPPGSEAARQITQQMANWGAVYGEAQKGLDRLRERAESIKEVMSRRNDAAKGASGDAANPEFSKYLDNLQRQNDLLAVQGAERIKLKVAQDLQGKATDEEIARAQKIAVANWQIEQSQQKLGKATKDRNDDLKNLIVQLGREADMLGMSSREAEIYKINLMDGSQAQKDLAISIYDTIDAYKESQDQTKALNALLDSLYPDRKAADDFIDGVIMLDRAMQAGQITAQQYSEAVTLLAAKTNEGLQKNTSDLTQFSLEAARNIQDSLGDGLYDLLKGKFDDIAKSWGDMITRMVAQAAAAQLGRYLFGDFGNTNQIGGLLGSVGSFASGLFGDGSVSIGPAFTFSANGNVFPSSPDLSALSGGIYNRPTAFRFAKGAGILGEAGSEAVMPLKRGPDGKLGVASQGGGGVTIIMNNNGTPQQIEGEPKVSRDQMGRAVIELMINDVRTNGRFTRTLKGAMT